VAQVHSALVVVVAFSGPIHFTSLKCQFHLFFVIQSYPAAKLNRNSPQAPRYPMTHITHILHINVSTIFYFILFFVNLIYSLLNL
jgi:hypothetical protein